jgi:hypothetical protein
MTYTALAIAYMVVCAGLGLRRERRVSTPLIAASLATAMVCLQLILLIRQ